MKRSQKSTQANHSLPGNVDILLPPLLEKRWAERIQPLLETLGVPKSTKFGAILGDAGKARLWSLRVNRPKVGSVVVPQKSGHNYRCGETTVRFEEGNERASKDDPALIKSVYGVSAMAVAAPPQAEQQTEWEYVPLLAVTNDFVTLVAEIMTGKDVFVGVEIWANAAMPVFALAQCPSDRSQKHSLREFRILDQGNLELVTMCETCSSTGKVECKKCDGKGQWQPAGACQKCDGECSLTCSKCGGGGRVECRRCGGTGDFIGKYGDKLDCGTCGGTGSLTCNRCGGDGVQECYVCKGTGEPPILDCNACSATGQWDCKTCGGAGTLRVNFSPNTGSYWCGRSQITPGEARGWDAMANRDYSLEQGACEILEDLEREAQAARERQEKLRSVQREISPMENCLNLAMDAQERPIELLNFRAVAIGVPEATAERVKGRIVFGFPMPKPPVWAREGQLPFALETPVKFTKDSQGQIPIEIKRQVENRQAKPVDPVFRGIELGTNRCRLLVSFPADVEISCLDGGGYLCPDVIPPSEMTQLKELKRWCSLESPVAQLEALVPRPVSESLSEGPEIVKTTNPAILNNPRQQEALNWIMSDAPLVLVKGPPGTGKTTVITEAVLQCIARGQKVLVCSETHQAVANVLERLHKDGRIRMLRHARQDSTKLMDLERDYLEGGAKVAFLREIRDRTGRQAESHMARQKKLEAVVSVLPAACAASRELKTLRDETAKTIRHSEEKCQKRVAAIEKENEVSRNKIREQSKSEHAKLKKKHGDAASSRDSLKKKIEALEKEKAAARSAYLKKTGVEPDKSYSGRTPWYKFPGITPKFLATANLLNERYSKACSELADAAAKLKEKIRVIKEVEKEMAASDANRDEKLTIVAKAEKDVKKIAIAERDEVKAAAATRLREEELSLLASQKVAAQAWNGVDGFETIDGERPPKHWEKAKANAEAELARTRELQEFCRRWHDATESAESALSGIFWNTTDVFLSTCVGLASWRSFAKHFGREGVDLAIIDEAAHVTLTQTMIPMGKAKRVVLIGDELQLPPAPPMELEDQCEKNCQARCRIESSAPPSERFKPSMSQCWLERSAFEWVSETRPMIPKVMLNRQFRMHPDIADFVADVFYGGSLENGVSASDRQLSFGVFGKAVCLVSTTAYKDRHEIIPAGATSYQNPLEVEMTRRVLAQARQNLSVPATIGVLTPYAAQKDLMRKELSSFYADEGNVLFQQGDIASVDSFQGSERDIMIASFVRSPRKKAAKCRKCDGSGLVNGSSCQTCGGTGWQGAKLNWVHDLRRLNVAFSRARKMLILIGDVEALTNPKHGGMSGREVLERFRSHVQDRGKVLHVWEEPAYE